MKGFLLKVEDYSVEQTVKVDLVLFPFIKELTKKREYFEFKYVPVCQPDFRKEMSLDFPESKLISDVWKNIDFVYFSCIQMTFSQMEQQRKTVPNFKDFIQIEIDSLLGNKSKKHSIFQTANNDNFNFAGAFQEVLIYEATNKVSNLKQLMYEGENEETFTAVYENLIDAARNNARLRVIDGFKQLLELSETKSVKKSKEKEKLKIHFSEEEMKKFLAAFKIHFFQDQWGDLYRKIYAISNLSLPDDAPDSNSYTDDIRINFTGKQATLVELFKRLRYYKKITPYKQHKTLADWLYCNFNYRKKNEENVFFQVSERTAEKYLAENERNKSYKQNYILKELFPYLPTEKRPEV